MVRVFNHPSRSLRLISLLVLVPFLAACNLPRATPVIPTLTSIPSVTPLINTPTASPTSLVPLPSNLTPTSTPRPGGGPPVNLLFASGTTAIVEYGSLQAGQSQEYTINVGNSQPMILLLHSDNGGAYLAVYDANDNVVLDPAKKWNSWQWVLSQKVQLYTIRVIEGGQAENYTLTVKVAARVTFTPGATTTTVTASTIKGYVLTYAVSGSSDQTMTVSLNAPANSAAMDIFGIATGDSLLGASDKATTFSGVLPSTQDYIIEVIPLQGKVVDFTLAIDIH